MSGGGEGSRRQRRDGIAEDRQRLAALPSVGEMAGSEFCHAGEAVGDALDRSQPPWPGPDRGKKCGEDCRGRLVAPVAEEAGESDAEDRAVQPRVFLRFTHLFLSPESPIRASSEASSLRHPASPPKEL